MAELRMCGEREHAGAGGRALRMGNALDAAQKCTKRHQKEYIKSE